MQWGLARLLGLGWENARCSAIPPTLATESQALIYRTNALGYGPV